MSSHAPILSLMENWHSQPATHGQKCWHTLATSASWIEVDDASLSIEVWEGVLFSVPKMLERMNGSRDEITRLKAR